MALDEDIPEQPEDKTIPKYKQIAKVSGFHQYDPSKTLITFLILYQRAGPYVAGWGHELDTQYEIWERENRSSSVPAKRAGSGQDDLAVRGKRSKIAPRDQGIDDAGMKDLFNANDINKVGEIIHATRPAFQPILGGSLTTVL